MNKNPNKKNSQLKRFIRTDQPQFSGQKICGNVLWCMRQTLWYCLQAFLASRFTHKWSNQHRWTWSQNRERLHALLVSNQQDKLIILSTHIVWRISKTFAIVALTMAGHIVRSGAYQELINSFCKSYFAKCNSPHWHMQQILKKAIVFGLPTYRNFLAKQPPCFLMQTLPEAKICKTVTFFELSKRRIHMLLL